MSSPLVPSALDARTQAFPVLSVSQIERIRSCSRSRQVAGGDILFEPGDENVPFYVLLSGRMEVVQPDLAGEHQIAKHGPGEFTGEMTMISGRRCLARGRVTEPGEFLELRGDGFRSLVARDAELSDIFMRAFILRRLELISRGQGNVILLGSRHSANTLRLREFLSGNGYPYRYVDLDTDNTSQELLDRFAVTPSGIPVVICSGRSVLRNPSNQELADCLGFNTTIDESQVRDLIIVGAGMVAHRVVRLECARRPFKLVLDNGNSLAARAIIIATGAQYNEPPLSNLDKFKGQGIYYGATFMEAQLCEREDVAVVGGGNSAGQAAVFLSQTARKVYMLVRSGKLSDTMSRYLIQRIEGNPAIELHYKTEIVSLAGDTHLERISWQDKVSGETSDYEIRHVFIMAGASPRTEWLTDCLALDDKGFFLTGRDLDGTTGTLAWSGARPPYMLETSLPGVFAVGDVRSSNVKRVASAVGEGAISISLVHRSLAEL